MHKLGLEAGVNSRKEKKRAEHYHSTRFFSAYRLSLATATGHLILFFSVSISVPLKERLPVSLTIGIAEMLMTFRRIRLAMFGVVLSA
jgi:hypothetical protein